MTKSKLESESESESESKTKFESESESKDKDKNEDINESESESNSKDKDKNEDVNESESESDSDSEDEDTISLYEKMILKKELMKYIKENTEYDINDKNIINALDFTLQVDIDLFKKNNKTSNTPPGIVNKTNRCWNISFIQMLYNIVEFRNFLIFKTPTINTDEILKDYNHLESNKKPADLMLSKNNNFLLSIGALKHIFKRLLRAELLNISYISGLMEHKIIVDLAGPADGSESKSYTSFNDINSILQLYIDNNTNIEEYKTIINELFNYSYIINRKIKKCDKDDDMLLKNFYDMYNIRTHKLETYNGGGDLIFRITLSNNPGFNNINKIKTNLFKNKLNEKCNKKIEEQLTLKKDFNKHEFNDNKVDYIDNYETNSKIDNLLHEYYFNNYYFHALKEIEYTEGEDENRVLKKIFNNKTILSKNNNFIDKFNLELDYKKQNNLYIEGFLCEENKYFVDSPKYLLIEFTPNNDLYDSLGNVTERKDSIDYKKINIPCIDYINQDTLKYKDNCFIFNNIICDVYDIDSVILHLPSHFTFIKKNNNNSWTYYNDHIVQKLNDKEADKIIYKYGTYFLY